MTVDFMIKPTQGVAFKIFQDQFMGVTEAQDPGPWNPKKWCEDKVSKYVHKATSNAAPSDK